MPHACNPSAEKVEGGGVPQAYSQASLACLGVSRTTRDLSQKPVWMAPIEQHLRLTDFWFLKKKNVHMSMCTPLYT